jgi:nucleoid DNA-binding protein
MIRSELILRLTEEHPDLTHENATRVVDAIFGEIIDKGALDCRPSPCLPCARS